MGNQKIIDVVIDRPDRPTSYSYSCDHTNSRVVYDTLTGGVTGTKAVEGRSGRVNISMRALVAGLRTLSSPSVYSVRDREVVLPAAMETVAQALAREARKSWSGDPGAEQWASVLRRAVEIIEQGEGQA